MRRILQMNQKAYLDKFLNDVGVLLNMKVKFAREEYNCTKAVKDGKTATLYLIDGGQVVFDGVNDWGAFSIEGGEWEKTPPTELEQLRADLDFISIMTGVSL